MTVSIAHAESPFLPYDKVIWYLMCYFQTEFSRGARCYSYVVLIQNSQQSSGQEGRNFMSTGANLRQQLPYSWYNSGDSDVDINVLCY